MMVRSEPAGAMLYVNKKPVGRTPVTRNFTHYGTMEFTVVKEGYETVTEQRKLKAPWYQWPGIDFFSEVIWPQEITDLKPIDFQLQPQRMITQDELVARADSIRRESQSQSTPRNSIGTQQTITPITTTPTTPPVAPATPSATQPYGMFPNDGNTGISGSYSNQGDFSTTPGSIGTPTSPFINAPAPQDIPYYQEPGQGTSHGITNPYNEWY